DPCLVGRERDRLAELADAGPQHAAIPRREIDELHVAVIGGDRREETAGPDGYLMQREAEIRFPDERLLAQAPPQRARIGVVAGLERFAQLGARFEIISAREGRRGVLALGDDALPLGVVVLGDGATLLV